MTRHYTTENQVMCTDCRKHHLRRCPGLVKQLSCPCLKPWLPTCHRTTSTHQRVSRCLDYPGVWIHEETCFFVQGSTLWQDTGDEYVVYRYQQLSLELFPNRSFSHNSIRRLSFHFLNKWPGDWYACHEYTTTVPLMFAWNYMIIVSSIAFGWWGCQWRYIYDDSTVSHTMGEVLASTF